MSKGMDHQARVYVDDKWIIRQAFSGNLNAEAVEQATKLSIIFKRKLIALGKPLLYCVNLRGVKKHTLGARRASLKSLRKRRFDRIAIVLDKEITKKAAESLVALADKKEVVRFFKDEDEAIDWLKSFADPQSETYKNTHDIDLPKIL